MSDLPGAARTSAFATVAGLLAGIAGGPAAGVAVAFLAGLPVLPIAVTVGLGVAIWLSPLTGVLLLVAVVLAVIGFVFGVLRKPPPGFGHRGRRGGSGRRWRLSLSPVVAWDPHAVARAQEARAVTGRPVQQALPAPQEFHLHLHGPLTPEQLAEVAALREIGYRAFSTDRREP